MPPTAVAEAPLIRTQVRAQTRVMRTEFTRTAPAREGAPALYEFPVSSEVEVVRWDWSSERGSYQYIEVLSHEPGAPDVERAAGGSLRDTHWGDQVGSSLSAAILQDRRLWLQGVRFLDGPRAQEIERGIQPQGELPPILQNVSIRYIPLEWTVTEATKTALERRVISKWAYIHTAFEPDPADTRVGPGRSESDDTQYEAAYRVLASTPNTQEERTMLPENTPTTTPAPAPAARAVEVLEPPAGGPASLARTREDEVRELCSSYNIDRAQEKEWLDLRLTTEQVRAEIAASRRNLPTRGRAAEIAPFDKGIARNWSMQRLVQMAMGRRKREGAEFEVHQEILRNRGQDIPEPEGLYIPYRMLRSAEEEISQLDVRRARAQRRSLDRTQDGLTSATGADLVREGPFEFMPLLQNETVLLRANASVLSGLNAPVRFSRRTKGAQAQWLGTGKTIDLSDGASTPGELRPKRIGTGTRLDKGLALIESVDNELMLQDEMVGAISVAIDAGGLTGAGGEEPLGILNLDATGQVQEVDMSSAIPSWAKLVQFPTKTIRKNALSGALAWIGPPELAACMQTTPRISGAAAGFLWEGPTREGMVAGYRALGTNQLDAGHGANSAFYDLIFGPWQYVVVGFWGGVEVVADPYGRKFQNEFELALNVYADVFCRFPAAFVKAKNCKAA